jgi:hypothetical protein
VNIKNRVMDIFSLTGMNIAYGIMLAVILWANHKGFIIVNQLTWRILIIIYVILSLTYTILAIRLLILTKGFPKSVTTYPDKTKTNCNHNYTQNPHTITSININGINIDNKQCNPTPDFSNTQNNKKYPYSQDEFFTHADNSNTSKKGNQPKENFTHTIEHMF